LSNKQKELIAIGASVTAHCQSCLVYHLDRVRQAGASEREINMAVSIGKAVQKGSNAAMEKFTDEQLGQNIKAHQSICQQGEKKESEPKKSSCCGG